MLWNRKRKVLVEHELFAFFICYSNYSTCKLNVTHYLVISKITSTIITETTKTGRRKRVSTKRNQGVASEDQYQFWALQIATWQYLWPIFMQGWWKGIKKYYCDCQNLQPKRDSLEHKQVGRKVDGV